MNKPRAFHSVCEVKDGLCVVGGDRSGSFSCETYAFGGTYGDKGQWTMVVKATRSLISGQPSAIALVAGKSVQPVNTFNQVKVMCLWSSLYYYKRPTIKSNQSYWSWEQLVLL